MAKEKLADVISERDYWREVALKEWDPLFRKLSFGIDGFDAEVTGNAAKATSMAMISMFKAGGAENFMEMSFFDKTEPFQRYTVTVQKVSGLSPADKLRAAEDVIADLRSRAS